MRQFLALLVGLCPFLGWGQQAVNQVVSSQKPFLFERYNQESGLSQGTGYAIASYDDFRWFGTQDGLNRFDGYGFKVFRAGGAHALNTSFVQALLADSQGRFWVGTGGGVNLYNKKQETFARFSDIFGLKHLIDSVSIKKIFEDQQHNIWVMAEEKGLFCFNPNTRQIAAYLRTDKSLYDFCFAPDGTLWVSSYNEIYFFDASKKQFVTIDIHRKTTPTTLFNGLATDQQGNLWIGTYEDGVYVVAKNGHAIKAHHKAGNAPQNLSSNEITCLMRDKRGRIWIGTRMGGISIYNPDNQSFSHIKHNKNDNRTLSENNVWQLYEDQQGIVWVGLSGQGINKYDPLKFQFELIQKEDNRPNNTLPDNMIFRLFGQKDDLYIGTESGGIARYSVKNRQFLPFLSRLKDPHNSLTKEIRNILTDHENNLWIANWKGLCKIDVTRGSVEAYPLLEQRKIKYLFDAKLIENGLQKEEIWVGGEEILKRFDLRSKTWKNWQDLPALAAIASYTIRHIYQDTYANIWLGTLEHGLFHYNVKTGKITNFDAKRGLTCTNIRSFCENNRTLWVGTDCGLFEIDMPLLTTRRHYTTANGLPNNVIYSILDDGNHLWLSSNSGLTRFSRGGGVVKNYDQNDGLQSNEFNTSVCYKHPDSTLFFGGVNGINRFKVSDLVSNKFVPPVKITKIMVVDSVYAPNLSVVVLKHDQNFIAFEFTALNFSNTAKNQYQYQLEGIDKRWINSAHGRTVNYAQLPPGTYIFRVKGSNNDGRWNEAGASVEVVVLPPFWATWWFRLLLIAVLLSGVYGVYRYRISQLQKQQQQEINVSVKTQELERQRLAKELHDGLGANLALLKMYLASIGNPKIPADELKIRSINLITDSLQDFRRLIHDMHPRNLAYYGLVHTITEMVELINQSGQINVVFEAKDIPQNLTESIEINLFRIVQELLQNAIKHAQSASISLSLVFENEHIQLKYRDEGRGFDALLVPPTQGNGLANIQSRVTLLKGTFNVASTPGHGTSVRIKVPV